MKKNPIDLEFSGDGTQVRILFSNGMKSAWFSSRASVLKALNAVQTDPPQGMEIRIAHLLPLQKMINNALNLPERIPGLNIETRMTPLGISTERKKSFSFFGMFIGRGLRVTYSAQMIIEPVEYITGPIQWLETPQFGRCFCDGAHWRFYYKDTWSRKFYSLEEGLVVYEELVNDGNLTREELQPAYEQLHAFSAIPQLECDVPVRD